MDRREKEEKVEEVIEELGLSHIAKTMVPISVATYLMVNDYSFPVTGLGRYSVYSWCIWRTEETVQHRHGDGGIPRHLISR